ncbi:DUF1127 domain-containing protein [Pelagibius litoralis]|uniref:DUF1127 domain-containing protein n=1 Tax=Pelagibius litoralis TaxID=374515 RepID=A0A967CC11_9PROT|nr:DUF1127 domain-containing protein [Pelagibius litoralis]NIA68654.1 DUF1127 domain-containing protein [Pelagibius litoralis]
MTRLNDLHQAAQSGAEVRWDPRSVDVLTAVQTARRLRAQFTAEWTSKGFSAIARLSGLTALFSALGRAQQRRRTLRELSTLSDRALADIGLNRGQIAATAVEATAVEATAPRTAHRSVWHMLADWTKRAYLKRKTISALSALSDQMLADIGIQRVDIRRIADSLAARQNGDQRSTEQTSAVVEGIKIPATHSLANLGRAIVGQPAAANENLGHTSAA